MSAPLCLAALPRGCDALGLAQRGDGLVLVAHASHGGQQAVLPLGHAAAEEVDECLLQRMPHTGCLSALRVAVMCGHHLQQRREHFTAQRRAQPGDGRQCGDHDHLEWAHRLAAHTCQQLICGWGHNQQAHSRAGIADAPR